MFSLPKSYIKKLIDIDSSYRIEHVTNVGVIVSIEDNKTKQVYLKVNGSDEYKTVMDAIDQATDTERPMTPAQQRQRIQELERKLASAEKADKTVKTRKKKEPKGPEPQDIHEPAGE